MKVKLRLFDEDLRQIVGEREVILELHENSTIKDLLDLLIAKFGTRVLDILVRPELRIMLNGRDIGSLGDEDIKLSDGDRVAIVRVIAGG